MGLERPGTRAEQIAGQIVRAGPGAVGGGNRRPQLDAIDARRGEALCGHA